MLEAAAKPLVAAGAAVLALDVARRIYRHTQIFCPSTEPVKSWNPSDYGIPREAVTEYWFETPDGEELYGWYCRSPKPIASALYCHGNTGNLTTSAEIIPHVLAAGINIFFFDYRGFGRSSGRPSLRGVIADGITAARFHDKIRPHSIPSILYGYSLGGAIAAQVVRHHPFDGLILQSTFTTLPELTRELYPRVPLHLVAGGDFDTLRAIRNLHVPLLLLHGHNDETVPCWMAHTLYEACPTQKTIQVVEGGLHKDLYVRDPDSLIWAINRFATSLPKQTPLPPREDQPMLDRVLDSAFRALRRTLRRRRDMFPRAASGA